MLGGSSVELDWIDDELFSTDYRVPTQQRHLSLLPEPPTVRLRAHLVTETPTVKLVAYPVPEAATVRLRPQPAPGFGGLTWYRPVPGAVWAAGTRSTGGWPTVTCRRRVAAEDGSGTEVIALIGIAVLVVLAVTATGVIFLWWA